MTQLVLKDIKLKKGIIKGMTVTILNAWFSAKESALHRKLTKRMKD